MYLHLGKDTAVLKRSVIGIFDLDNTSVSKRTRSTLSIMEKEGKIIAVSDDLPRSCVLCEENGEVLAYLSQISPLTLSRRWEEEKVSGDFSFFIP